MNYLASASVKQPGLKVMELQLVSTSTHTPFNAAPGNMKLPASLTNDRASATVATLSYADH
ncbi:MAG: hypothetical protein R6W92_03825 [Desulfocurvibacter africanus]